MQIVGRMTQYLLRENSRRFRNLQYPINTITQTMPAELGKISETNITKILHTNRNVLMQKLQEQTFINRPKNVSSGEFHTPSSDGFELLGTYLKMNGVSLYQW